MPFPIPVIVSIWAEWRTQRDRFVTGNPALGKKNRVSNHPQGIEYPTSGKGKRSDRGQIGFSGYENSQGRRSK